MAFARVEMATSAKWSRVVPYTCMWRFARSEKRLAGASSPKGAGSRSRGWRRWIGTGATARVGTTSRTETLLMICWIAITLTTTRPDPEVTAVGGQADARPTPASAGEQWR